MRKWVLTPEILEKVKDMAHKGCTEANIARCVGLHQSTWIEKKKEYPELEAAIKDAKASGEKELVGILWEHIRDPNTQRRDKLSTIYFMLKTRHHWRETDKSTEVAGKDGVDGLTFSAATKDES